MMRSSRHVAVFLVASASLIALFAFAQPPRLAAELRAPGLPGESAILGEDIKRDVTFLAADDKAGRKTAGGILEGVVTDYLEAELKRLKLEPAGVDGYRQPWRYRAWEDEALSAFAPRRVDHEEDENHLHGYARQADGSFPADAFGSHCNEQGLAFSPEGQPVSIENVDAIPTLAPAAPNTHNLVAKIRGRTKPDEYIVLGAHMDHIGTSMWGSGGDKICNGADDNGSGTSTLLAIARGLAAARDAGHGPERSVLIIWFSGEELGLLGSQYFVGKPTIPLASIKAMINVDMTGRLEPDKVSVCDKAPAGMENVLHAIHDAAGSAAEGLGFRALDHNIESYLHRSDQYSFYKHKIPVMFFFEGLTNSGGLNPDYHRITDHADKIDSDKASRIGRLMFRHVMGVANHR